MASENKKAKTDKRKHWGRDGKFLKDTRKFKRLNFFNASFRRKINNIDKEVVEALEEEVMKG